MRTKWLAVVMVGVGLVAAGCTGGAMARKEEPKEKELSKATVVTCPKCGNPFQIGAGLTQAEKLE